MITQKIHSQHFHILIQQVSQYKYLGIWIDVHSAPVSINLLKKKNCTENLFPLVRQI